MKTWAARSACEPPIKVSTNSSANSKQPNRSGSMERCELGRQGAARLSQPSPDRAHAPPLSQLARQQANEGNLKITRAFKPRAEAFAAIPELGQVWRARSTERLEQALDNAQSALLKALESNDPRQR